MNVTRGWTGLPPRWIVPAAIACLAGIPVAGEGAGGAPSTVAEIIVKFAENTEAGRHVESLLRESSQDVSGLAAVTERLGADTGVQLTPRRITSGREVVFAIAERPLLERLEARVEQRADVEWTELVALKSGNPRLPQAALRVRFRQSSNAFDQLERAHPQNVDGERVQALASALGASGGVPVRGVAESRDTLSLVVDRAALLDGLAARVGALDYVDYAQPNATMQILK